MIILQLTRTGRKSVALSVSILSQGHVLLLILSWGISDVGNYYSLRAEHERAVKYFRRATQLDRTYLAAWTLMGHEYVEMKNSHAAIEAYRKAVGTYHSIAPEQRAPDSWAVRASWRLEYRCQSEGLPSMVWPCPGVRVAQYAPICLILLPTRNGAPVCASYGHVAHRLFLSDDDSIRPYDVRIWQAQGMCYEEMGR